MVEFWAVPLEIAGWRHIMFLHEKTQFNINSKLVNWSEGSDQTIPELAGLPFTGCVLQG